MDYILIGEGGIFGSLDVMLWRFMYIGSMAYLFTEKEGHLGHWM